MRNTESSASRSRSSCLSWRSGSAVWRGRESFRTTWKKAKAGIARLHQRIANIRKEFLHRSSNEISKNHAIVFVEDLQVRKMCKSSKGTKDQPGKQVAQKSGLNRAILDGSPFELRRQLQYKTAWRGGLFYAEPPQSTSRTCQETISLSDSGLTEVRRYFLFGGIRQTPLGSDPHPCAINSTASTAGSWTVLHLGCGSSWSSTSSFRSP